MNYRKNLMILIPLLNIILQPLGVLFFFFLQTSRFLAKILKWFKKHNKQLLVRQNGKIKRFLGNHVPTTISTFEPIYISIFERKEDSFGNAKSMVGEPLFSQLMFNTTLSSYICKLEIIDIHVQCA